MYVALKKHPQSSNLYLAPGATKPNRAYLLKLVAEKNGAWGKHEITLTTGASSEDSSGSRNEPGGSSSKTWDEGASQAEVAAFFSRAYVAGRFAFILDGADAGWLHTAEAGNVTAGLSMQFGPGMSKSVFDWIQSSWNKKHVRRNGAIVACDFDYSVRNVVEFTDALITAIQMPALDAGAKDPCYITTSFKPDHVKFVLPDSLKRFRLPDAGNHKLWTPANFRLKIDGLEEACSKVKKVEALTIKQKVTENPVGEMRDYNKEPASLEVPNLVITLPESQAEDFYKWYENASKGTSAELKNGTLEYQAADKSPLVMLTFKNLGIFKLTPGPTSASSKQVTVEMYCEQMTLNYSPDILK
jgi:tail tube protein gp19